MYNIYTHTHTHTSTRDREAWPDNFNSAGEVVEEAQEEVPFIRRSHRKLTKQLIRHDIAGYGNTNGRGWIYEARMASKGSLRKSLRPAETKERQREGERGRTGSTNYRDRKRNDGKNTEGEKVTAKMARMEKNIHEYERVDSLRRSEALRGRR